MRKITAATAALLAAIALAIVAWVLALASSPVTGPQPMAWHKADGSPPTVAADSFRRFRGCSLADINLDMAVWNRGVIVPCRDEALGAGWAFLDPRTQQATLRWPLPNSGEALLTQGLLPGPERRLAIVFQQAVAGDSFVGIANAGGWERPPESLGRVRYLAGAWIGNRLELVVVPVSTEDRYGLSAAVKVIALEGKERRERVAVPACGTDCHTPQMPYRAGGRWVFEDAGRAIAEGGESVAPAFPGRTLYEGEVDLLAQGTLRTPDTLSLGQKDTPGIGADGKPTQAAPPPWSGMRIVRQNRFTIDDGGLRRRPQWADASLRAITEQAGDRTLTWDTDDSDHVRITDARQPSTDAMTALTAVAQWPKGLASRVFLPDETGGFWLVDSAGESIHLDSALRRTDPLSLRAHLQSSRTLPVYALGWALFGLPILLLVCVGLSLCITPRKPGVRDRAVKLAAVLYLVSGGWALLQVVPLL
ncbi:hypothetical protein ACSFB7_18695 [Variovorax sp. GB1P17]